MAAASAPEPALPVAPAPDLGLRAQAIDCGSVKVAVPFSWARNVVETFDVSVAPNAPAWLVGAANVDGHIVPVVDLAAWIDEHDAQPLDRASKLLVGGAGDDAFALLFQGLPMLARYVPGAPGPGAVAALAPYHLGEASLSHQKDVHRRPVIDALALGELWINELAL